MIDTVIYIQIYYVPTDIPYINAKQFDSVAPQLLIKNNYSTVQRTVFDDAGLYNNQFLTCYKYKIG